MLPSGSSARHAVALYNHLTALQELPEALGARQWFTLRQLARMMSLRPSAYARLIVSEMVAFGELDRCEGRAPNGTMRHEFSLALLTDNGEYYENK